MDNQHTNLIGLAYLAGIIDGEGCITIERNGKRRKSTGRLGLQPSITVTNTDCNLIAHCEQIFASIGAQAYIKSSIAGKRNKRCYWLVCKGQEKVRTALKALLPYLVAKRGQAQLTMKFIESRTTDGHPKGKGYSDDELALMEDIQELNQRGVRDCRQASE